MILQSSSLILLAFVVVCLLPSTTATAAPTATENAVDENVVHVHMVGHTHDDPGWLKTVDEYYR